MAKVNVPVLVIAFNRPEVLQKLLDRLSENRYRRLYFFVDHERTDLPADKEKVEKCKKMVEAADISDEKFLNFASENLGCGFGPFSAITRAFESTEELIILEDDCIPAPSFFPYCEYLLARYRDEQKVWMISGNNFSERNIGITESYTFSGYAHFWGWATWKRSWQQVEYNREKCLELVDKIPETRFFSNKERKFFEAEYRANLLRKSDDLWDYQAALAMSLINGLSIVPQKNLVSNIGMMGTHFNTDKSFFGQATDPLFTILSHPAKIERDIEYDMVHFEKHWLQMNKRSLGEKLRTRWGKISKMFLGSGHNP